MFSKLLGVSSMRGLGAACTFLLSLLIGRLLDVDDAGRVLWAIAATSLLAIFARGGLDKAFMKMGAIASRHAPARDATGAVIRQYAWKIACASVVLGCLLVVYGALFDARLGWQHHTLPLIISAASIAGIALTNMSGMAAIGSGETLRGTLAISVLPSLTAVLALLVTIYLLGLKASLFLILAACAAGWLLAACVCLMASRRITEFPEARDLRISSGESRQFSLIGISNTLEQWLPTLVAGVALNTADAAGFALSARLVAIVQLLMVSATSIYARPYATTELAGLRNAATNASLHLAVLGLPAIAILFIFAPQALSIFGAEYAESAHLLRILLVGQAANVLMGTFSVALIMHDRVGMVSRIFMASSVVQIFIALLATALGSSQLLAWSSVAAVLVHTGFCTIALFNVTRRARTS